MVNKIVKPHSPSLPSDSWLHCYPGHIDEGRWFLQFFNLGEKLSLYILVKRQCSFFFFAFMPVYTFRPRSHQWRMRSSSDIAFFVQPSRYTHKYLTRTFRWNHYSMLCSAVYSSNPHDHCINGDRLNFDVAFISHFITKLTS